MKLINRIQGEWVEKIIVYTHSDCLLQDNGLYHPEKKERIQVILQSIQDISNINIEFKILTLGSCTNVEGRLVTCLFDFSLFLVICFC